MARCNVQLSFAGLILCCLITIVFYDMTSADQRCEFKLSTCPESFNNDTIYVPKYVTKLSPNFYVCKPEKIIEDPSSGQPPSIMFVIDNSNSMRGTQSEPHDSGGVRFKVTSALLDTIYKRFPRAEVGLTVFSEALYFDTRDNPNFVGLPSSYGTLTRGGRSFTTQGYLPLLKLDSTVAGGIKAINLIKNLLETKRVTITNSGANRNQTIVTTDLKYEPQFEIVNSTNINLAFEAAKLAMQNTTNAKEDQFIIFLSDGEPTVGWPQSNYYYFQQGINVPTTFTVFFVASGESVPPSIATMTGNIQKNGYSENNPLSSYYSMTASYDGLLNTLMNKAINPIFTSVKQEPTSLVLNNVTYSEYDKDESTFIIPNGIVLKDSVTNFDMKIKYKIRKDSSNTTYDSTVKANFYVVRTDSKKQSQDITLNCKDTILFGITVKASDASAAEKDNDPGKFEFSRTNIDGELVVYFDRKGTALNDVDYTKIADSIKFPAGVAKVPLEIKPITDDYNEEGDETVIVKLLSNKNGRTIRYEVGNPDSAIVIIHDIEKEDTINVAVLINPFSPSSSAEDINSKLKEVITDPDLRDRFMHLVNGNSGTILSIQTSSKLKPTSSNVFGKALLFDALGNKIKELEILDVDSDRGRYGAFWDGTNYNHRKVGNGTYLMKMIFTNSNGKTNKRNFKVGVKN